MQRPSRFGPPVFSISSAVSSKSRPSSCRRPRRVLVDASGSDSRLRQRLLDQLAIARFLASARVSCLSAPGCTTTPTAPIPSPTRSAWTSESSDFVRILVVRRRVDQVDGVDHHRLRPCDAAIASRKAAKSSSVYFGRPPHPRALVEDLDRLAAASRRRARWPWQGHPLWKHGRRSACERSDTNPSPSPLRPVADRRAPHRRGTDGTLQLALRPRPGGDAGAADRGHRPRALHPGERRADPRRPPLARARLGRGPAEPGRARRAPRRAPRRSCSTAGAAYRDAATADDVKAWKKEHGGARLPRHRGEGEGARCGCGSPTRATRSSRT